MRSLIEREIQPGIVYIAKEMIKNLIGSTTETAEFLETSIDEILSGIDKWLQFRGGFIIFEDIRFDKIEKALVIKNVRFNTNGIIFKSICKSDKIALFVCTAGGKISWKSQQLMEKGEYLSAYIYDLIGSLAVEQAMDILQEELKNEMSGIGLHISNRYSPGYCGWNLNEQKKLFSLLPKDFCGVSLNDSCLMQPIKSISGMIGIGKNSIFENYSCEICEQSNCLYRNLK